MIQSVTITAALELPAPSTPKRIDWLDAAKGMGIVLVVVGHALGGIIDSPMGDHLVQFRLLFFAIYSFHMPLFFLLSGLLVAKRLEKGSGTFMKKLLPTVVWPYFLWSVVQYTIIFLLGSLVNRPADSYWSVILALPWNTVSQFWFLYALFWLHLLASFSLPRLGCEAFILLALALKALVLVVALPVAVKLVCNHAFFYALGVFLGVDGVSRSVLRHSSLVNAVLLPLVALLMIALTVLAAPHFGPDIPLATSPSPSIANLAWRFPVLAASLLSVAALLGIANLPQVAASRRLAALGRLTMPIFVLHIMFIAGTRIAITHLHFVSNPLLLLVCTVCAGVLGPLVCERVTRKLGLNRFLGFG